MVDLTSTNPNAVEVVTSTVTIPQGTLGANGSVRGKSVGTSTVTASRSGYSSASAVVSMVPRPVIRMTRGGSRRSTIDCSSTMPFSPGM